MKILLLTQDFPPVLNSSARLFSELAEDLQKSGYNVTVLTRFPIRYLSSQEIKRELITYKERRNGVNIQRIKPFPIVKHIPLIRALDHLWTSLTFLFWGLFLGKHEIIIVYSPPLPLVLTGWILSKLWGGKIIANIQDIYPQTVVDLGLLKNRFFIKLAEWLEVFVYKKSTAIVVHSEGNKDFVIKRGAIPERVFVIENWIDLEAITPGDRNNRWRKFNGFGEKFIVSFAGTFGFAQGLTEILKVAEKVKEYPEIIFVLAGDGVYRNALEKFIQEKRLANVKLLPHQPPEAYKEMLQASDICLVTLDKNLKTPVVPGKLQSIMAAGRPVICIANPASDAKRIIEEAKCGYFFSPDNIEGIKDAILEIYSNRDLGEKMGNNGRVYAEKFFDRKKCIKKYLDLILTLERRG